ncbi:hypothetical protein Tco_0611281 [Tanacetum coccineum]
MMTARKRVRSLPTHHLAVRHSVDYSSSDHFSLDDSSRDLSPSSSSKTSSDSFADALSDSASSRSSSNHSLPVPSLGMRPSHHLCLLVPSIPRSSIAIFDRPSPNSSSASPSRKRSRSLTAFVPLSSPTLGALSYVRADLLPLPKRIRSSKTNLEMDVDVVRSDGIDIDLKIQLRLLIETGMRGPIEVRVDRVTHPVVADDIPKPAQEGAVEVTHETLGDLVKRFHDHIEKILGKSLRVWQDWPLSLYSIFAMKVLMVIKSVQRDQGHWIVVTRQQSADMLERIKELERDNMRLRDMMDVASQRAVQSQRLRLVPGDIWATVLRLFLEYPSVDPTMPNTRSGASRTRERVNKQIDRQMAGALGARNAARNLEPLMRDGGGQEEVNGNRGNGNVGNRNGGNGNGNENRGGNGYNFGRFVPARVHISRLPEVPAT